MELRRSVNTKIWDDIWFSELCVDEKVLWLYLLTNSQTNMLGIYEISERKICFDTSLSLDKVRKAFKAFESVKKAKYLNGYVILFNWIKNQSYNPNMIKSAIADLNNLPTNVKISVETVFLHQLGEKNESLKNPLKAFEILPKKEKEKEGEIEEENEDEKEFTHNEIFRSLYQNENWVTLIAMKYKSEIKMVLYHLNEFRQMLLIKSEYKKNEKDAKTHFINWIEKGNPIPNYQIKENSLASNPE